jgi:hypothetical protein
MLRQNPPHDVLIDFQTEGVGDLLGNTRATKTGIETFDLENCGNQFLGRSVGSGTAADSSLKTAIGTFGERARGEIATA